MDKNYNIAHGEAIFRFQTAIYPTIAVLKTAFIFIDDYYIYLSMNEADLIVTMKGKKTAVDESVVGEFFNEMLNQLLRLYISGETKAIRELIMARALHNACLETGAAERPASDGQSDYHLKDIIQNWFEGEKEKAYG